MTTGFTSRTKGKEFLSSACQQGLGRSATSGSPQSGISTNGGGNIIGAQYASATGVGNTNDATEDLLWSFSLPANSFDVANRTLAFYAWGVMANNAHTKTARFYFGTSIVVPDAYSTGGAITPWVISGFIVKASAGVQVGSAQIIANTAHGGAIDLAGTETDTAAILLKITGQTSVATANDVVLKGVNLQFLN